MLRQHLSERPLKGPRASEPFIDHNAQRVLVAGGLRLSPYLLRSDIGSRPGILGRLIAGLLLQNRHAKISEQQFCPRVQQHILWLDIAVDDALIVRVL
jgi:hypothetical protein